MAQITFDVPENSPLRLFSEAEQKAVLAEIITAFAEGRRVRPLEDILRESVDSASNREGKV